MKLKRILEQQESAAQFYDLGKDFSSFTHTMDSVDETVKNKFEQAIGSKLKGKKIKARASRGYKQFEKDYEISVTNVSLDDYYDNYVVVVRGTNGKEYFLKPGFKVQILGAAEQPSPEQPKEPPEQKQPPPQKPPETPPQQPPSQAPQEEPPVKEDMSGPEAVRKYPVDKIQNDLMIWLVPLLANKNANLKQYIPREGVSRTKGRRTITSYAVTVPVEDCPALSVEQIKQQLQAISKHGNSINDIDTFYKLDKFDVRGDKYVIIVNKITNY